MATNSTIEWTEATWNPVLGCSIVSPGCHHCYAMPWACRLKGIALAKIARGQNPGRLRHYIEVIGDDGRWNGKLVLVPEALTDPLRWRRPKPPRRGSPKGVRGDGESRLAHLPGADQAGRPDA